jgi:hypothetical protein
VNSVVEAELDMFISVRVLEKIHKQSMKKRIYFGIRAACHTRGWDIPLYVEWAMDCGTVRLCTIDFTWVCPKISYCIQSHTMGAKTTDSDNRSTQQPII